jgi:DNA-binding GntR family transcriptional regulator
MASPAEDLGSNSPRTLAEEVYLDLRSAILWGELAPGAPLRSDDLRKMFSVGISPLREALSRLTSEGLVTGIGQRGFRVAELSSADIFDTMETRILIDSEALRRSMKYGDVQWETGVVASHYSSSRITPPTGPGRLADTWVQCHRAFHLSLVSACRSPRLLKLSEFLFDEAERHRNFILRNSAKLTRGRDAHTEHDQIVKAALARDEERATTLLSEHYRRSGRRLIEALDRETASAAAG